MKKRLSSVLLCFAICALLFMPYCYAQDSENDESFIDVSGFYSVEFSMDKNKVSFPKGIYRNSILFVASYADNKLVDVKSKELSPTITPYEVSVEELGVNVTGADTLKSFVLLDTKSLAPYGTDKIVSLVGNYTRDAYQFVYTDGKYTNALVSGKSGTHENLASGWVLDNRGGSPRLTIENAVTSLEDVSTTEGTALIREINKTEDERIVAEFSCTADGDGAYVEFCDENGDSVYKLMVQNGYWSILDNNEDYIELAEASSGTEDVFRVYIDQQESKAQTFINNENCGEHELLSDNILNFRFATDENGTATVRPGKVNMVANYAVYEVFDLFGVEEVYNWEDNTNASVNSDGELVLEGSASVTKSFLPIGVKYIAEMLAIFPESENAGFKMMSGDEVSVEVKSEDGKLFANGTDLSYDLTANMWYRLRVEADPGSGKAKIVLNGRTLGEVELYEKYPVGSLVISSESGNARFDDIRLYANIDHDDYVPVPETKANLEDYIVAANVCSLWRNNGTHYGWACITPYDEREPVLGYYDEGNPETADWEIKYMVEHGIDVQAFCWYADVSEGPIKTPRLSYQLHDGYQQAKYKDYMKYCLIWECAATVKFDMDQFKNFVVPYWFENYFLDENYFTLDDKIVLNTFGTNNLAGSGYFGSYEAAKEALEYLDSVATEYGFDGVVYMSNSEPDVMSNLGISYRTAYSWGEQGYDLEHNKAWNEAYYSNGAASDFYQIPTISVGFNDLAWNNDQGRTPMMTVEDYDAAFAWVKNTYLKNFKYYFRKPSKDIVWISTWNEYGEGTYVSPSGLNKFGYLDALRNYFPNSTTTTHKDVIPTEAQAERINRLYPQYSKLLRNQYNGENTGSETDRVNLFINGISADSVIVPVQKGSDYLFAFDPETNMHNLLHTFMTWNHDEKTLKLEANGKTVVFTVGSNKYTVDGEEYALGYTLYTIDGLPMISMNVLSTAFEFEYSYDESTKRVDVKTDEYESLYEELVADIINGDAENTKLITFTSPNNNATISITDDGTGNHAYLVTGPTEKAWSYIVHDYPLVEGNTYKITGRVKYVGDSAGNTSGSMNFYLNVQYNDVDNKKDHTQGGNAVSAGEWTDFAFTHTVKKMKNKDLKAISFYANPPTSDTSAIYMIDDLKVELVG